MIKSLRWKFIIAAMISLSILIVIIIGGIALLGYYKMEQVADGTLQSLATERKPPEPGGGRPPYPAFGYQINENPAPTSYFVAIINSDGQIQSIDTMGRLEITENDIEQYVGTALSGESLAGKIGAYKYVISMEANRPMRIVFLDMSLQMQTLLSIIFASFLVGLLCMVLMFFILFFVSGRVISPLARNIEKQRQFVSNAGHEIKTPLGIIMANTDAMELHLGENKWSKNVRSQTERMHGLMDGLLLLARMDEGAESLPRESVNLSDMVNRTVVDFSELAKKKQIQTRVEISDNIIIQGNPDYLEQLINILIDNAVKYSNSGGEIITSLTGDGRKSKLAIENSIENLPDVPPETLFDRFYRANAARTQKDGGYGIGLSAARAIAGMHGGKIVATYVGTNRIRFAVELS